MKTVREPFKRLLSDWPHSPHSGLQSAPRKIRDFIDWMHESAGLNVGRIKRVLHLGHFLAELSLKKIKEDRRFWDLLAYTQLYQAVLGKAMFAKLALNDAFETLYEAKEQVADTLLHVSGRKETLNLEADNISEEKQALKREYDHFERSHDNGDHCDPDNHSEKAEKLRRREQELAQKEVTIRLEREELERIEKEALKTQETLNQEEEKLEDIEGAVDETLNTFENDDEPSEETLNDINSKLDDVLPNNFNTDFYGNPWNSTSLNPHGKFNYNGWNYPNAA